MSRRSFSAEFKFKVVLEALSGHKTMNQIASEHKLNPVQISTWKKEFLENGSQVFSMEKDKSKIDFEKERSRLHQKVGELTLSVDFLKKKINYSLLPGAVFDD